MIMVVFILALVALIYLPAWWATKVLQENSVPRIDIRQSGSEFAISLLEHVEIKGVEVTPTAPATDHYNPVTRKIGLSPDIHQGRTLTAIVAAAHEVGHAIQHAEGYWLLEARSRLVGLAQKLEQTGSIVLVAAPFVGLLTRNPRVSMFMAAFMLGTILATTLVHLITLPMELDASFKKAMPYLSKVEYLHERDLAGARKILTACALTYLATSLRSLLDIWRWLRILKR
jgi:hypothetical protein